MFQVQVQEEGVHQGVKEVARQSGAQDHRARFQENDQVLQSHQGHCSHSGTNQNHFFFFLELTRYSRLLYLRHIAFVFSSAQF